MSSGRRPLRSRSNRTNATRNEPVIAWDDTDEEDNDYIPDLNETEDDDAEIMFEEDEEDDDEFMDVEDNEAVRGGESSETPQIHIDARSNTIYMTPQELMGLLRYSGLERSLLGSIGVNLAGEQEDDEEDEEEEVEEEDDEPPKGYRRSIRKQPSFEPVPNPTGQELMFSGTFGHNERQADRVSRDKRLARRLLERELGGYSYGREQVETSLMKQDLIPESIADSIIKYESRCYSGQFSADGSFFFCCTRGMTQVRMYDTSNPYKWKYYKSIISPDGSWTVTDASLSNDNRYLAISTLATAITLAPSDPLDETSIKSLDFANLDSSVRERYGREYFYLFSVRWSGDSRELVGGASDRSIYVYDLARGATVLRIPGHKDDVNAVCFGDENSPHILYSGSDDATIKVWDRRSLAGGRPAGVFLGHVEGLTYVDSKGDGLYVISNGKDQTAKLWDLRKMHSAAKAEQIDTSAYSQEWDYRGGHYDVTGWRRHPYDCSLVTFRGHSVAKTLIRCHFSPPGSSDSRYIYSGSRDGKVYIWNLDATLKAVLNVSESTSLLRGQRPEFSRMWDGSMRYETVVRDASWHPHAPMIAATAWNGWGTDEGVCTIHSWNDGLESDESSDTKDKRYNSELSSVNDTPRRSSRRTRHLY